MASEDMSWTRLWALEAGAVAIVEEVDGDGDFRLKNPSGQASFSFHWREYFNYVQAEQARLSPPALGRRRSAWSRAVDAGVERHRVEQAQKACRDLVTPPANSTLHDSEEAIITTTNSHHDHEHEQPPRPRLGLNRKPPEKEVVGFLRWASAVENDGGAFQKSKVEQIPVKLADPVEDASSTCCPSDGMSSHRELDLDEETSEMPETDRVAATWAKDTTAAEANVEAEAQAEPVTAPRERKQKKKTAKRTTKARQTPETEAAEEEVAATPARSSSDDAPVRADSLPLADFGAGPARRSSCPRLESKRRQLVGKRGR
jgi:hypothetical protein